MKLLYLNILFLFLILEVKAQETIYGLYVNNTNNEFICIQKDTILFKFYNNDALGSYTFYYGEYEYFNNKIKLKDNNLSKKTSSIKEIDSDTDNYVKIHLLYHDNQPIKYAVISLIDTKYEKDRLLQKLTNDEGYVSFTKEEIELFLFSYITIKVEALGFITEHRVWLSPDNDFSIKSLIPSSIPFIDYRGTKLKYHINENNEIELNKFSKFKKSTIIFRKDTRSKCGMELFIN